MNNTIFITGIFCIILAAMLYSGVVKMFKMNFKIDPPQGTYQSEDLQKTQSQRAADIEEKNRRIMERTRAQMERAQAQMERSRR